jgi:hypothetical protein
MADNGTPPQDAENYGMPANWVPVENSQPIIPGRPSTYASGAPPQPTNNALASGVVDPSFGLQTDVASNDYGSGIPVARLMPVYGGPQQNSKIQTIVEQAVAASSSSGSDVSLSMPSQFTVAGSPGDNLSVSWNNVPAHYALLGPLGTPNTPAINAQFVLSLSGSVPTYTGTETLALGNQIVLDDWGLVTTRLVISAGGPSSVSAITDGFGNTYTQRSSQSFVDGGNTIYIQVWSAPMGTAVGTGSMISFTATVSGSPTVSSINLSLASVSDIQSFDAVATSSGSSGNAVVSLTPTSVNEFMLFVVGAQSGLSVNPNAPFTLLNPYGTSGGNAVQAGYYLAPSLSAITGTWVVTGGYDWTAAMVSFLPTLSGSGSAAPTFRAIVSADLPGGGGGSPGGTSGELQYNDSGAFGGVAGSGNNAAGNITLAPPATGVALTITGAPDGSESIHITQSGGLALNIYVQDTDDTFGAGGASYIVEETDSIGSGDIFYGLDLAAGVLGSNAGGDSMYGGYFHCRDASTGGDASEATSGFFISAFTSRTAIGTGVHVASPLATGAVSQAGILIDKQSSGRSTFTAIETDNGDPSFFGPISPGQFTVSGLPSGIEGQIAYATNGRKVGELSGAGTGVPVYFSNSLWRVFSTDSQVLS